MDYTPDKNALLKAQWDLIHNPENVQFAWSEEMEEGAIIDFSKLSESVRKELLETINKLKNYPSPIFAHIYSELEKKYRNVMGFEFDNVFQVNIMDKNDVSYYKEGQNYFTASYFKKAENTADVEYFPEFHLTNVKFGGSSENPDLIVFQPKIEFENGDYIEGQYKNTSTVFEEFFHAGQYLWYTTPILLYEKEVEVEVAKAYEYYLKGWSEDFFKQTEITFLRVSVVTDYFKKIKDKQPISTQ